MSTEQIKGAMIPSESTASEGVREAEVRRQPNGLRKVLKILGPGLVTGASDDDPSGIGTYSMAGAAFGYATLWLALITFPLMAAVQYICAKVGLVAGRGLAAVLRDHYPRWLLYPIVIALLIANTLNAGADIGAIAAGVNLLVPVPVIALIVPIAILLVVIQVWGSYRLIANIFKWLTLSLFAYIGSALLAKPDFNEVLRGTFVPTIRYDGQFLAMMVAILGTTISPYLFFWQTSQEVEEQKSHSIRKRRSPGRKSASDNELRYATWDVSAGMFISNLVMYFIILACAATLHQAGTTEINSAEEAAQALRPLAGNAASLLMALGLIGTGLLAVPVLTASAGYAVCEVFQWKCGLDAKPHRAKEFYLIIAASTLVGLLINFMGINPIHALFWSSVLNGMLAPPLLVLIMLIANKRSVLGEHVNGPVINVLGWVTVIAMSAAAIGMVINWTSASES